MKLYPLLISRLYAPIILQGSVRGDFANPFTSFLQVIEAFARSSWAARVVQAPPHLSTLIQLVLQ